MRSLLAPFLALVLLSGCVAPIQATRNLPQPTSLAEVNALLEGRRVTIERTDGRHIDYVRDAIVTETEVQYTVPAPGPARGRSAAWTALQDVQRITYVRNRGTRHGAAVGAIPVIAMTGLGIAAASQAGEDAYLGPGLLVAVFAVSGAIVSAVTVPVGAWIGQAASPGGIVPLYEGPVDRYLVAPTAIDQIPPPRPVW